MLLWFFIWGGEEAKPQVGDARARARAPPPPHTRTHTHAHTTDEQTHTHTHTYTRRTSKHSENHFHSIEKQGILNKNVTIHFSPTCWLSTRSERPPEVAPAPGACGFNWLPPVAGVVAMGKGMDIGIGATLAP